MGWTSTVLTTASTDATTFERSGTLGHVGNGGFVCNVATAPGTGFSDVCAVYQLAVGATAITCTISNTATSCSDMTDTATVTLGTNSQYLFTISPSAGAASTVRTYAAVSFASP